MIKPNENFVSLTLSNIISEKVSTPQLRLRRRIEFPGNVLHETEEIKRFGCIANFEWNLE